MKLSLSKGGLEYTESDIGSSLSVGGIATTLISLYAVPKMERKVGSVAIYRMGMLWLAPLFSFLWTIGIIWDRLSPTMGWVLVSFFILLKNTCLSFSFAGVTVVVTNSVPQHHLGSVNGYGQTFAALARTVGPAFCGLLWSIGIKTGFVPLTFFVIGLSCVACLAISAYLPSSLRYSYVSSLDAARKSGLPEVELT